MSRDDHPRNVRHGATSLKNFDLADFQALSVKGTRQLFDCREKLKNPGIALVESDIKPTDRFLMERFITGGVQTSGAATTVEGFQDVQRGRLTAIDYRPRLRAVSIDIETDYRASELYSIALYSSEPSSVLMLKPETWASTDTNSQAGWNQIIYAKEAGILRRF